MDGDGSGEPQRFALQNAGALRLEMVFSPAGPDTDTSNATQCKTLAFGSAFTYQVDGRNHLITARHNLTGRHWQTNACLGARPVSPTHLKIMVMATPPEEGWRLTRPATTSAVGSVQILFRQLLLPLIGEDWAPIWLEHPELGARMDVAALPLKVDDDLFFNPWMSETPATKAEESIDWPPLAIGHDVFIAGYPYGLSTGPALPLWTRGTIASEPMMFTTVDNEELPIVLVDARTRSGQSGSVVMRQLREGTVLRRKDGLHGVTPRDVNKIVGVYSGRYRDDSDLGFVWRIEEVDTMCRSRPT